MRNSLPDDPAAASPVSTGRAGHTLVEVVVACTVFLAGVLATQAAATAVLRQARDTRIRQLAIDAVTSRFERYVHSPCTSVADGSASDRGVLLQWTAGDMLGGHARAMRLSARFPTSRGAAVDVYAAGLRCR